MENKVIYKKQLNENKNNQTSALRGGGVIGIDFGATHLRAAMVSEHGLDQVVSRPTPNKGSAFDVWQAVVSLIKAVVTQNNGRLPAAICVGVPSVVDTKTGTVYNVQHIPSCTELPLGRLITETFGVICLVNNDANAFALGEYYFGEHLFADLDRESPPAPKNIPDSNNTKIKEPGAPVTMKSYSQAAKSVNASFNLEEVPAVGPKSSLVGLTIGTGLGAGLILDGKLYSGSNCGAGEIGCLPYLDANLERYVSGAFFNKDGLDGQAYFALAQKGDNQALALYQEFGHHLGQAIKIVMYTYDPNRIVLGGSISQSFDLYKDAMINSMQDFDYPGILQKIKVYPSKLEHSAILGAASLYFDYVKG